MNKIFFFLPFLFPVAARAQGWNNAQSNTFATSLVRGANGDFWAGADDEGVFHRDAKGNWAPFAGAAELGDVNVTCIAVDPKNRVWVGTASAGVAVFDGEKWKRFGVLNGPLSNRVNDLKIAFNGDVWGATDAGVFRWNETNGWTFPGVFSPDNTTRTLANHPVYSLAFDSQNRVLEAVDEGLNRLSLSENGEAKIEALGRGGSRLQPPRAQGDGFLPGPVHAVAFDSQNQIWCATRFGVCVGKNDGKTWRFLRGADWLDNAKGSALPLKIDESNPPEDLLGEDWVTTLAPTPDGKMWLGFRGKGAEERDCETLELLVSTRDDPTLATAFGGDWTNAILPFGGDNAAFARFGGGLASMFGADLPKSKERDLPVAPMPENAQITQETLVQLAKNLSERAPLAVGSGAFYSLDRQTRGDWPLRYGNAGGELFSTGEERWMDEGLDFHFSTAPHLRDPNEADFFTYTHWNTSDNPNVLQLPLKNIRRQSEFNDGTWQDDRYPPSFDGPDLWTRFSVPEGLFRVSYYWFNKDAHSDVNRMRDHRVELFAPGVNAFVEEPMARARLWNGWNGQYVSFAVRGPANFRVRFARDRSHGTQLQSFFFDRLGALPTQPKWLPARFKMPLVTTQFDAGPPFSFALDLWEACNLAESRGVPCPLERLVAIRAAKSFGAPEALLAAWRVQAGVWDDEGNDRKAVAVPSNKDVAP